MKNEDILILSILNNNNSMVHTADFKVKADEPDGPNKDNFDESLKHSDNLEKT